MQQIEKSEKSNLEKMTEELKEREKQAELLRLQVQSLQKQLAHSKQVEVKLQDIRCNKKIEVEKI